MNKASEAELVRRAKAGDVPAFEGLYRSHKDRVYSFAKQITGSPEDAGDILQDTFVKAWHALPSLRSDETFLSWLHRIALNLSSDLMKRRGRQRAVSLDSPAADPEGEPLHPQLESGDPRPESTAVLTETREAVSRAIESLSADHRLVVTMHHIEGMDVESIARALNVPRGTVMSRLSRAREVLRRKLIPYVEDDG